MINNILILLLLALSMLGCAQTAHSPKASGIDSRLNPQQSVARGKGLQSSALKRPDDSAGFPGKSIRNESGARQQSIAQKWRQQIPDLNKPGASADPPGKSVRNESGARQQSIAQKWRRQIPDLNKPGASADPPGKSVRNESGARQQSIAQKWRRQIPDLNKSMASAGSPGKNTGSQPVAGQPVITQTLGKKKSDAHADLSRAGLSQDSIGSYYALIIGIDDYLDLPKLKCAIHDAQSVGKLLKTQYGFSVSLLQNADRKSIITALNSYRRKLSNTDNLLIYYAGHGWYDKAADAGYWLPSDAEQENETAWISHAYISSVLRALEAKHVMIVADSCYSGKLTRGLKIFRKSPNYYEQISKKRARVVLTSGGIEPVVDSGGKEGHSVFASAFLRALQENKAVLDGTNLFTQIRRPVILNSDQTPEYSDIRKAGHDGGDFIFVRLK